MWLDVCLRLYWKEKLISTIKWTLNYGKLWIQEKKKHFFCQKKIRSEERRVGKEYFEYTGMCYIINMKKKNVIKDRQ